MLNQLEVPRSVIQPTRERAGASRRGLSLLGALLLLVPLAACTDSGSDADSAPEVTEAESGGAAAVEPDRTIAFDAVDFTYQELGLADITVGETILFEMANSGTQAHEFEVLDPQGEAIGEVAAVEAGESGEATLTFEEPGTYTYQCILVDENTDKEHTMLGMTGTFEVVGI